MISNIDLSKWNRGLWPDSFWVIRYLLPYHKEFHIPAIYHDQGYELALQPRKDIDDKFLKLMLKQNTWKPFAILYYLLVRIFWWLFYNKN